MAERRAELTELRAAHDRALRDSELRRQRLETTRRERESWSQRREGARRQIEELSGREASTAEDLQRLERRPAEIGEQRMALLDHITNAERVRKQAADALFEGEVARGKALKALKEAEAALHEMREERVRLEGGLAQADSALQSLTARARERLDCAPQEALALSQHDPSAELPEREGIETLLRSAAGAL